MRVITRISWWDESPTWLAATIASCASFSSHVVAVDGAYALFASGPRAGGSSGSEQHEAVVKTCEALGLGLTLHVPPGPWEGNEVEKRSLLFRLGEVSATPWEDWYFVIDADEVVLETPADLLDQLRDTDRDVGRIVLMQTLWRETGDWDHGRSEAALTFSPTRQFFRAIPGLRVEGAHHFYRAERDGRVLWLNGHGDDIERPLELPGVLIDHRNALRGGRRGGLALGYYDARERAQVESTPATAHAVT